MAVSGTSTPMGANAPIGVFDSGVGGLSVLRHLRAQLPQEDFLYFADTAFAPYGEKGEALIIQRTLAVAAFLRSQGAKAIVVACNTATAAAVEVLRAAYPAMPIVGVEPGLKPGAALSKSGKVGVLATEGTLASVKFRRLQGTLSAQGSQFITAACNGLADQVEKGEFSSRATFVLLQGYVQPLLDAGADTLVLGCTHYPFVRSLVEQIAGPKVAIIDTGEAVARQMARLLEQGKLNNSSGGALAAYTSGSASSLAHAFQVLLGQQVEIHSVAAM